MSVGEALRDLGQFLDECEAEGSVNRVELSDDDTGAGSPLTAEVEVELSGTGSEPNSGGVSLREARVDSGGGLVLGFESVDPVVPADEHDIDVEVVDASLGRDGSLRATLSAAVTVDDGGSSDQKAAAGSERTGTHTGPDGTRDVPPFRDVELLREVYASCDTFAEMTEEIGMDVTAETVRRYMIDHGIHEPNSYDTAEGSGDERPDGPPEGPGEEESEGTGVDAADGEHADEDPDQVVLADGIGLPENVTVETLIETVKNSNTIYEVTRNIGVDRQNALEMLRELNLLDLVVGRLATEAERDITREDVVARLREASATAS